MIKNTVIDFLMNVHLILLPIPKDYGHLKKSLLLRILQRLEQIHLVFIHLTEIPFIHLDLNLKKKISESLFQIFNAKI